MIKTMTRDEYRLEDILAFDEKDLGNTRRRTAVRGGGEKTD